MTANWATLWHIPEAIAFALANAVKGNLDHHIYSYPTTRIMRVTNGEGCAIAYLPVHSAAILESVGWAPDLNAGQKTTAVIAAANEIEREVYAAGYREIFFVSSDERIDEFAERHLSYERTSVMRRRLR